MTGEGCWIDLIKFNRDYRFKGHFYYEGASHSSSRTMMALLKLGGSLQPGLR